MVDESGSKALEQVFRFDIDEFDLVGVVEDAVRDSLAHDDSGDGRDYVVQALDMLDVHRRVDIYACTQELFYILIAFFMTVPGRVCMG